MKDLYATLIESGIDKHYRGMGLDVSSLFPEHSRREATERYGRHEWVVKTIPKYGTIINAVPPDDRIGELPWEEWYVLEGKNHHHVLYLDQPDSYAEIFEAPAADDVHPPRTLGRNWYVVDDPDMSPMLLR